MKILMLSWEFPPKTVGGLARHVDDLSHAMAKQGHDVHIITSAFEGSPEEEEKDGVHIHRVNNYSIQAPNFIYWVHHLNMAMMEKAIHLLKHEDFNIIHAHDWLVALAARALKNSYRLPVIATIHATECGRNGGLHNEIQQYINSVEWFLTYEAWKVIVCSKHMVNEVKWLFDLPEDKLEIVPNGIFADKFSENFIKKTTDIPYVRNEDKVVLFVGRLVQEKGVQVLLDSARKVLHYEPNTKFIIVGSGPMEGHLKSMGEGFGDRVYFTGYVSDAELSSLYKRAAVAVFPSLYEPFGIVALEAMATETPVVVSDVGGLSEIIEHGRNGLKAYPGNANSLADNILTALLDKKIIPTLVKNAMADIENKYDWNKIASKTISIYQDVQDEYEKSEWSETSQMYSGLREQYLLEEKMKYDLTRGEMH